MDLQDLMFKKIIGIDKHEFERTANLMRNPEGWEESNLCPVCKKEIITNKIGDLFCSDFDIGYKESGKCFWHRYKDGLNYWSTPEEMFKSMCEKDPKFKKQYESVYKTL